MKSKKSKPTPVQDALLVGVFEGELENLDQATEATRRTVLATRKAIQRQAAVEKFTGKVGETLIHFSDNRLNTKTILLYGLGLRGKTNLSSFRKAFTAALRRAKAADAFKLGFLDLDAQSAAATDTRTLAENMSSYLAMVGYVMNHRKTVIGGHKPEQLLEAYRLQVPADKYDEHARGFQAGEIIGKAVNIARSLSNEPANSLTPGAMAAYAQFAAETSGGKIECRVYDREELSQMGANLLLAVSEGSEEPPYLIDMLYTPTDNSNSAELTIVGKSVTFDSGGIDIKVNGGSRYMKRDMSGGGVAIAAIQAIAALGLNIKVRAVMAATENMVDGRSYKPGDVITSMNGLTVEIDNTDAEGRLTLADAIEYAKRQGSKNIVDLATLTGAVKSVTGDVGACAFGNHDDFTNLVVASAMAQDEKLLNVPMWEEFRAANKTDMADLKNSGGNPGSTTAAFFIRAFAGEEINWVHLDIAGVAFRDRELGPDPKGATGFGVRTLVELARRLAAQ